MDQMDQKTLDILETTPVKKALMKMVIPMMLSFIATLIYNITDAYFIGKLDNTAMMAAVTLSLPISAILMALGHLFGTGSGTYISRLLGEGKNSMIKNVSSVNLWLSIIVGVLFMMICLPLLSWILQLIGARGDTFGYTKDYILIFMVGAPIVISNFTLEEAVRAEGASTNAMIGMILGVVVNIVLDPIFIFVLHMGIMGAAFASVIGNAFSVLWFIYYLQRKSSVQSASLRYFKPTKEMLYNIIKIGISAFLLDLFLVITCVLLNNYAMLYGENVIAGIGISQRVVQIADFVSMSFSMGAIPLLAYSYSSMNHRRLKSVIKITLLYMIGITMGLSLLLFIFKYQVIGLFSIDTEVIAIGQKVLIAQLSSTIFAGLSALFTSIFQAFGKGIPSTIMSFMRGTVFIPILIIGNKLFEVQGVIWAMTISEIVACLVGLILWIGIKSNLKNFDKSLINQTN